MQSQHPTLMVSKRFRNRASSRVFVNPLLIFLVQMKYFAGLHNIWYAPFKKLCNPVPFLDEVSPRDRTQRWYFMYVPRSSWSYCSAHHRSAVLLLNPVADRILWREKKTLFRWWLSRQCKNFWRRQQCLCLPAVQSPALSDRWHQRGTVLSIKLLGFARRQAPEILQRTMLPDLSPCADRFRILMIIMIFRHACFGLIIVILNIAAVMNGVIAPFVVLLLSTDLWRQLRCLHIW